MSVQHYELMLMSKKTLAIIAFIVIGSLVFAGLLLPNIRIWQPKPTENPQAKIISFTNEGQGTTGMSFQLIFNVTVENTDKIEIDNTNLTIEKTVNGSINQAGVIYLDNPSPFTLKPKQIVSFRIDITIGFNDYLAQNTNFQACLSVNGTLLDKLNLQQ